MRQDHLDPVRGSWYGDQAVADGVVVLTRDRDPAASNARVSSVERTAPSIEFERTSAVGLASTTARIAHRRWGAARLDVGVRSADKRASSEKVPAGPRNVIRCAIRRGYGGAHVTAGS
jgi:hypothetical protein